VAATSKANLVQTLPQEKPGMSCPVEYLVSWQTQYVGYEFFTRSNNQAHLGLYSSDGPV